MEEVYLRGLCWKWLTIAECDFFFVVVVKVVSDDAGGWYSEPNLKEE